MKTLFDPIKLLSHKDLQVFFGSDEEFALQPSSIRKDFHDWKMEVDDSPILRYIYRTVQPKRHLEFGTWKGIGASYVLEETAATVWTINAPFGETLESGKAAYSASSDELPELQQWMERMGLKAGDTIRTDSVGFIGRKYLMANLGGRVCQIYSDSREWDTTNYPREFFDSVLIDGGHTEEIVANDTLKALPLLRSGGIMLWHDFCPDPQIMQDFSTCRGVVNAIEALVPELHAFREVRWIYPSFVLMGIKS